MMKKRILFVIPYLVDGGAERALSNITRNIANEWEIDILVNSDKVINYPCRGNIITLSIDKEAKTSSVFFQFKVLLKRVAKLRKLKRENHYTACISFLDSANVANILSGKKYCRVLISCRCSMANQTAWQYKYVVSPLIRIFYNKADKVVAVSRGIAEELKSQFGIAEEKVGIVENGYDLEEIKAQSEETINDVETAFFSDRKVIITAGRLEEQKAQWHLIRAFFEVQKTQKNLGLMILGEGSLEKNFKNLVKMLRIEDKVYFTGYTNNPYKYVSRADIFVMPSLYEGFPNALAEAICMGKPCIATDFPTGARELLCPERIYNKDKVCKLELEEFGIITPLCSEKFFTDEPLEPEELELAYAMSKLLEDATMRQYYSNKSIERSKTLDISITVEKWLEYVEK